MLYVMFPQIAYSSRRLACVGAIIIIAALGISFSLQALVVYHLSSVPTGNSTIARTNEDNGNSDCEFAIRDQFRMRLIQD